MAYAYLDLSFPDGLPGLSQELLADHLTLHRGYVDRTNKLLATLRAAEAEGRFSPELKEYRRRLGFEFSGMRLHEAYFRMLSATPGDPDLAHPLQVAIRAQWGDLETWWKAFTDTCTMPGIGWGVLLKDPATGELAHAFLEDHQDGMPVGMSVVLAVDVWEHAYASDYRPTGRGRYVEAIRPLLDWRVIESAYGV
jgi:Fe-Mn family superoxide dismutase